MLRSEDIVLLTTDDGVGVMCAEGIVDVAAKDAFDTAVVFMSTNGIF